MSAGSGDDQAGRRPLLVNGAFGSITDLVAAQLLRQVSSYYADVRVDDPSGGYTLIAVANGPCANVPVAG